MYIVNGICYAGESVPNIEVKSVKPLEDMMMLITFSTGEVRLFDATTLKGPVFEELRDEKVFKNVSIDNGVVTWLDGEIDCAPEYMYENSYAYEMIS